MRHSAGDGSGGNWMEAAGIERMNVRQLLLKETSKWSYGSHLWPRKSQRGTWTPPHTHTQGAAWTGDLEGGATVPVTSLADIKKTWGIFTAPQVCSWNSQELPSTLTGHIPYQSPCRDTCNVVAMDGTLDLTHFYFLNPTLESPLFPWQPEAWVHLFDFQILPAPCYLPGHLTPPPPLTHHHLPIGFSIAVVIFTHSLSSSSQEVIRRTIWPREEQLYMFPYPESEI